jgi:hypothetical protein
MRTANRLPYADLAVIDERKITHYLLASDHPAGRAKAAMFQRFGFAAADWQALRDALLVHARERSPCVGQRHRIRQEVCYRRSLART